MALGDYNPYNGTQICNCTLPYFSPGACERCSNNRRFYNPIITYPYPSDWNYVPVYKPTKKTTETWEEKKHILEEIDEQGNEKTVIEEFDDEKRLIKKTTVEKKAIPELTYAYPNSGSSTVSGTISGKTTTSTTILNEENITYT